MHLKHFVYEVRLSRYSDTLSTLSMVDRTGRVLFKADYKIDDPDAFMIHIRKYSVETMLRHIMTRIHSFRLDPEYLILAAFFAQFFAYVGFERWTEEELTDSFTDDMIV